MIIRSNWGREVRRRALVKVEEERAGGEEMRRSGCAESRVGFFSSVTGSDIAARIVENACLEM